MTSESFDTERFIHATKETPCLWDFSSDDYSNRVLKKQKWEELVLLFGGDSCLSAAEKNELSISLQNKWRHIKDAFNREKRRSAGAKSGSGAARKSQYIYYNMLTFLNNATPPTNTQQSLLDEVQDPDDPQPTGEIDISTSEPTTPRVYHTTVLAKKRKPQDHIGKQQVDVLKESINGRQQRDLESNDEDRLFLLSLVNEFKNIPRHKKLSAKRQILSVIETHQSGGSNDIGCFQQGPSQNNSFYELQTQPNYGNYVQGIHQQGTSGLRNSNSHSLHRNTSTPHSTGSSVQEDDPVSPLLRCFSENSC